MASWRALHPLSRGLRCLSKTTLDKIANTCRRHMQATLPLPQFRGPKLEPFRFLHDQTRDVEFLEPLGRGAHAEVWRVSIDGSVYALKLFRFVKPTSVIHPDVLRDGTMTLEEAHNQNDPFHCECRAYGRLKEEDREDLAVRCYGYVLLTKQQEDHLAQLGTEDWNRYDAVKDQPIRGIVKEYIPDDGSGPFTFEMLPQMRRDIQDLNRLGIVVWDVRTDNYCRGRLVDFSQARTAPHTELAWDTTIYTRSYVMECCARDIMSFDGLVEEWNEQHPDRIFWPRFFPNFDFGRRLRNKRRYLHVYYKQEGARFDAAFYDWKAKHGSAEPPSKAVKNSRSTRRRTRGDKSVAASGGVGKGSKTRSGKKTDTP